MAKKKETEFEKLARLIKGEGDDVRGEIADVRKEMKDGFANVREEMRTGFAVINRRLDTIIQIQLDQHAHRIKKLETAVFPK